MNGGSGDTHADRVFTVERRTDGVAVVWMDVGGERVNSLRRPHDEELRCLLDELERMGEVEAAVFASGKPDCFVVGPEVNVLERIRTVNDGIDWSRAGQQLMDRVAGLRLPMVAAIQGTCLGNGLELALACRGRVASLDRTTVLGLPQVELGLLPANGGTQRLAGLIGLDSALKLLLSGEPIRAERARALGLVDAIVRPDQLLEAAAAHALELARYDAGEAARARPGVRTLLGRALHWDRNPVMRRLLLARKRREIAEQTRGNYPAPPRIIEAVEAAHERDRRRGFWVESRAFGDLATSHQAVQLVYLHRASSELANEARQMTQLARRGPLGRVGLLGAGVLAEQLSSLTVAEAGLTVFLEPRGSEPRASARGILERGLAARLAAGKLTAAERDSALRRWDASGDHGGFRQCDLVVEVVAEDLGLKRQALLELEDRGAKEVVFATTAMAWPLRRVAEVVRNPSRVVGIHYTEPVVDSALLEVVADEHTSPAAVAALVELGQRQGKTVLVVRDGPGGYAPRLTTSLLVEGLRLLQEGVSVEALEGALRDWGFGRDLLELFSPSGLERWGKVAMVLGETLGERLGPPELLARMVRTMRRGPPAAESTHSSRVRAKRRLEEAWSAVLGNQRRAALRASEIAQRCALRLVDEAVRCYAEGIVGSARDGDVGAVRGVGFPSFRGGPFRYVDEVGTSEIVRRLGRLERERGQRFTPAPLLVRMAQQESTFHGPRAVPPGTERERR